MDQAAKQQTAGQDGRGGQSSSVLSGRAFCRDAWLVAPVVAASVAVFLAAPWLDERLVWAEWIGVAAGLVLVRHLRGFRGEGWSLTTALVQANPSDPDGTAALRSLTAARAATAAPPDLVCWPECSAGEFDAQLDSVADPARVARRSRPGTEGGLMAGPAGIPLLCGGLLYEGFPERPKALYQSALLVDAAGGIRGRYDKRHLMPFGEYVPLAEVWPDLRRRFPLVDDFAHGSEATVLVGDGPARIGVMLCYEDMLPATARSLVRGGATVLVSLVNGNSFTTPRTLVQHRQLAQLRAVERRRSLVRCAATGQTCVISPAGKIVAALPLHARGTLAATVPLIDAVTFASRAGPLFPLGCAALAAMLVVGRWRSRLTTGAPTPDS